MKTNFEFKKNNKGIMYSTIFVFLYSLVFHGIIMTEFNLAIILGTTVGLILFPFILATILNFIYVKIRGNENSIFLKLFIFFIILFTLSNLVSTLNKEEIKDSENETIYLNENSYEYKPDSSSFSITFPDKPNHSKTFISVDSEQIEGDMMELMIKEPESVLRVEYLKNELITSLKDEEIVRLLNEFSIKEGMYSPQIKKLNSSEWKEFELRMYKNLESLESKELVPITYRVKLILNNNEMMIVSTGCQSSFYPTITISEFNNSFRFNNQQSSI